MPLPKRTTTILTNNSAPPLPGAPAGQKLRDFGGFPGPVQLLRRAFKRAAPSTFQKFERTLTLPYKTTLEGRNTPWFSFETLVVGRNSDFRTETLSDEEVEELGGVEYRALRLLSYLVPIVRIVLLMWNVRTKLRVLAIVFSGYSVDCIPSFRALALGDERV